MNVTPPRRLRARAIVTILGLIVSMAYTVGATALVYAHRPLPESLDIAADAITTLFAGIAFMAWLHRARVNLDGLGVVGLRWRPGWTIGGWLLPLANLVIPLLVVREVDRATALRAHAARGATGMRANAAGGPAELRANVVGRGRPSGRAVFVLWAVAWLGYLLVGLGLNYPPSPGPLTIVSAVLLLAAGVFAILLVRRITADQDAAMTMPPPAQAVQAGPPPAVHLAARPALPAPAQQQPAERPALQRPPFAQPQPAQQPSPQPRPAPHPQPAQQPPPPAAQQPPPAQVPPDAPPPTGPAVDPWPGAGY